MTKQSPDSVILVGGFHEIIELCERCGTGIIGIIDNKLTGKYYDCFIIGTDEDATALAKKYAGTPVVLTPDDPSDRERLHNLYAGIGYSVYSLIDPSASVSPSATIGIGVIIQHAVNVSSAAAIGDGVKLNTRANIMHDATIGAMTTVAPNAVVLGRVSIGHACYIGANATVLPGIRIGDRAVIGAGAVVTRDVADGQVVRGNPGRPTQ